MAEIGVVGTITIPLMKRIGYSPTFAGAVEATAACGGVIDPPVMGAVAFVMADFTGIGYGRIALAAVLPAILYYLSLFFQLDLRAAATGLKGLPKSELPTMREALGIITGALHTPGLHDFRDDDLHVGAHGLGLLVHRLARRHLPRPASQPPQSYEW
jgi:TRAP-type uncharacterized transport system fused permease subunit